MTTPVRSLLLGFAKGPLFPGAALGGIWFIGHHITQTEAFWVVGMYFVIPMLIIALSVVLIAMGVTLAIVCRSHWERAGAVTAYVVLACLFYYVRYIRT